MVHNIDHLESSEGGGAKFSSSPPQLRHCCLHVFYNVKTKSRQNHKLESINIPKIILSNKVIFNELSNYLSNFFVVSGVNLFIT